MLNQEGASHMTDQEARSQTASSHNRTGMCYARLGDHAEARREFETAISIDPRLADAHCNLGNVLRQLGDLDGAAASYDRVLEIEPERLDARLNLISTLRERNRTSGLHVTGAAVGDRGTGGRVTHARVQRVFRTPRADYRFFPRGVRVVGYCLAAVIVCVTFVLWILRR